MDATPNPWCVQPFLLPQTLFHHRAFTAQFDAERQEFEVVGVEPVGFGIPTVALFLPSHKIRHSLPAHWPCSCRDSINPWVRRRNRAFATAELEPSTK